MRIMVIVVHLEFEVGKIVIKDIIAACASADDVPLHIKSSTKIDHGKGYFAENG